MVSPQASTIPQALRYVLNLEVHQECGSCSWSGERECKLVKHASAFTQGNEFTLERLKHYSVVNVLLMYSDCSIQKWKGTTLSSPSLKEKGFSRAGLAKSSQTIKTHQGSVLDGF